ncbi:MAG: methyltransferase [Planctomycetia bacterium]|nr:methyltransferase [Planctomycetia bacterium]
MKRIAAFPLALLSRAADKLVPPIGIVLGSPMQAAALVEQLQAAVCFQLDLYQADRLRDELERANTPARVETAADLWDLPAELQTLVYPAPPGGERALKIDMVEQAYHTLKPGGRLVVLSPYANDPFFPELLKKTFGRAHMPADCQGQIVWAQRGADRPRRRHEVTFHATINGDGPLEFVSRPGVFSCGKFDLGARALLETAEITEGERVLDLGCGSGTNGVFAGRRSKAPVTFLDSNRRATALAELNAQQNGLTDFRTITAWNLAGLAPASFDLVLANPPYYAQNAIARQFIEQARPLLRPDGRLHLVTKQPEPLAEILVELFEDVEGAELRGYTVLMATI